MKSRDNTVNFLQIENSLTDAIALCLRQPDAPFARTHTSELQGMREALQTVTAQSDQQYLAWRELMRQRMLSIKHLWQRFETIRDTLGEYGYEPYPKGRFNYWDDQPLREATLALVDFLEGHAQGFSEVTDDVPEARAWATELRTMLTAFERTKRDEDKGLEAYKRVVPMRRQAIYHAMDLVGEFEVNVRDYNR
jgi:hypothetical protein